MTYPACLIVWRTQFTEGIVDAEGIHAQEGLKVLIGIYIQFIVVFGQFLIVEHLIRVTDMRDHGFQLAFGLVFCLRIHPIDGVQDLIENSMNTIHHF